MDTELLRTFLEIRRTRHFAQAAENLCLTQAAVSARIKQLEQLVGQPLFTRTRNNIQLTPAGHLLVPHAESIINSWSSALMEATAPGALGARYALGCVPTLREIYVDNWLGALVSARPEHVFEIQSMTSHVLLQMVRERSIHLGILYEPPRAKDIWAMPITRFEIQLVASQPGQRLAQPPADYIYVDWGPAFAAAHNEQLSAALRPRLKLDSPNAARQLLVQHGGAAYLAEPMLRAPDLSQRLFRVVDAPTYERTVYLVGSIDLRGDEGIDGVVAHIVELCAAGNGTQK